VTSRLPNLPVLLLGLGMSCAARPDTTAQAFPYAVFADSRDPPTATVLTPVERDAYDLGHAVFNTQFVPAGTPQASRRDGVGPLFNAPACDGCHNDGALGRGISGDGPLPAQLVIQLRAPVASERGDPVYGRTLNTAALPGLLPEGKPSVRYIEITGHYADGGAWSLRRPEYRIDELTVGSLAAGTVLSPRMAPALFGLGQLQHVPSEVIAGLARSPAPGTHGAVAWHRRDGRLQLGRFGWQGDSVSLADQTGRALAREMGLTSNERSHDDCTTVERACQVMQNGGIPEISSEFFDALVDFQSRLAVPAPPQSADPAAVAEGKALFQGLGCSGCHREQLPLEAAIGQPSTIAPYTDLLLHDLGLGLADHNVDGRAVPSRWRTAPLWGLGYALRRGDASLLHDGRARGTAEAVLWHDGEARAARNSYIELPADERRALDAFLRSL
jgi:CxxC motif-containing protein (DUF1111 family)